MTVGLLGFAAMFALMITTPEPPALPSVVPPASALDAPPPPEPVCAAPAVSLSLFPLLP